MENNLEIIGNESFVLNYNLNKQYSTVKKVIITKDIIFSYADSSIEQLFSELEKSDFENYSKIVSKAKNEKIFESNIKADLYKIITDSLVKLSSTLGDIKLKDYSFMNSVSNTKFNVTLRCEGFSITKYYEEKTQILSAIKNLVREYVEFKGNSFRQNRIKNFQIEIYESEEVYKHVTLKKEGSSLILVSNFGFAKNIPIDHNTKSEIYVSKGDDFNFYKNSQDTAIIREYNKLTEAKTKQIEKILANEELVHINNNTKHINDVILEMYITKKGVFRILNVSIFENSLYANSTKGFIINRSSNNFDKIEIVTLRDNLSYLNETEALPKFLLIRNEAEIKDLFLEIEKINLIDGIIFNINFYSQILDEIGQTKNLDIIYYSQALNKISEIEIDMENVSFNIQTEVEASSVNAFSNILNEKKKGINYEVERLRRIEENIQSRNVQRAAPQVQANVAQEDITSIAQGLISSPNASTSNNNSKMALSNNNSNQKKSAIGFLADMALNNLSQKGYNEEGERVQRPANTQDVPIRGPGMNKVESRSFIQTKQPMQQQQSSMQQNVQAAVQSQPMMQNQNVSAASILDTHAPKKPQITVDSKRYDEVVAVKILANPGINSQSYFTDINTISEVQNGEIFFLTTSSEEMTNSNIKYIMPINMQTEDSKKCHLLINSINEFFLVDDKKENQNYFVNLSHIEAEVKTNYLKSVISKLNRVSLILLKEDLNLIEEFVNKIDAIYIRDFESDEDYNQVRNTILTFEKRYIMKNL